MELKEISAGNLVMYKNQICRIIGFSCKDKMYLRKIQVEIQYFKNMLGYGFTDIDEVEPIKLTEEWFLKFGFELFPWGWVKKTDTGLSIRITIKNYFEREGNSSLKIEFVHQLQNLFYANTSVELNCA